METSQIITLLSGAGIGAVLSAILVFVNNSKRNQLDYITRERSEWRKKIENISFKMSQAMRVFWQD